MFCLPRSAALAITSAALAAGAAFAAEPAPAPAPTAAATSAGAAAPAPAAVDHPIALRDDTALTIVTLPDGARTAVLDASFMSTSVAKVGPDGKVIVGCVNSREEYDAFFAAEALPDGAEVR